MITADKILSEAQLNKLIKTMRAEKDKSLGLIGKTKAKVPAEVRTVLDYYCIALIAHTGLRVSEALNLTKSDVHEDFLIVRPEISKNKKRGTVYYGPRTKKLIWEFLAIKRDVLKKDNWDLIFSINGKVPSRSYLHTRFKKWVQVAGLEAPV